MSNNTRILIGYWNDSSDNYPQYPIPVSKGTLDSSDYKFHNEIADYLDSGDRVNQYRGISVCRFDGHGNGTAERCDDKYVWPDGLSHYVRDHHVVLPDEFIEHIIANNFDVPQSDHESIIEKDETFWLSWMSTGKSPKPPTNVEREFVVSLKQSIQDEIDKEIISRFKYINGLSEVNDVLDRICSDDVRGELK